MDSAGVSNLLAVPLPTASIILAVLDEAEGIDRVLDALTTQSYGGSMEFVVADGGSVDGTRERLDDRARADTRIVVIDNPGRRQSPGLNTAAQHASGEFLIRADGHTVYDSDYVHNSVAALLETGVVAVGGRMNPVSNDGFGAAVAGAMNSPMVLPAQFHHAEERQHVDTVYLGAFRRSDFLDVGGFRSFPSGTSEDADLYARWRARGRTVLVDPSIRSQYEPRSSVKSLWKQYFRYGKGKAEMLWVNRQFPSPRPLAPALLALGLVALTLIGAVTGIWWPLATLAAAWLVWLSIIGLRSSVSTVGVMTAGAIMHLSYGLGLMWGLIRGPGPVRRALDL
jgi:succinoglycan biosynthesis protein ExoA